MNSLNSGTAQSAYMPRAEMVTIQAPLGVQDQRPGITA